MAEFRKEKKARAKRKSEDGNSKVTANVKSNIKRKPTKEKKYVVHPFEYNMSQAMAEDYLADRKMHGSVEEKKMNKYEYLCYVVNEMHGLMGTCVKVHII